MPNNDIDRETEASVSVKISSPDEVRQLDVININGVNRAAVDANISSINVPLGKDPLPDAHFYITKAGAIGDTIRLVVQPTANDVTSPDRDAALADFTYTLVAADVGDEQKLAENFVTAANAHSSVQNAFLELEAINDGRAVVHISSTNFSLNAEFYERPNAGDVAVTVTGTTEILLDGINDRLVSRAKEVSLARDPNSPHRLGVQSISGTVRTIASNIDNVFKQKATDGLGNDELYVDGSVTPVLFSIDAEPAGGRNIVVEALKLFGTDTNIKVNGQRFLGTGVELPNGILIEIRIEGVTTQLDNIRSTEDMMASFSTRPSDSQLIGQSGGDFIQSLFDLVSRNVQITLTAGSTDRISATVRDDLTSVDSLHLQAEGFLED